jgi:hypothetical protein
MMRLRELEATSPLLDKAKSLVSSVDALPDSPERLSRLRRELDRPRAQPAFGRRLPALSAAGAVLLLGASAFAAVRLFGLLGPQPARSGHAPLTAAEAEPRRAAPSGDSTPTPQLAEASSSAEPFPPPPARRDLTVQRRQARVRARPTHKLSAHPHHTTARPSQATLEPNQPAPSLLPQAAEPPSEASVEASQPAPFAEREPPMAASDDSQPVAVVQPTAAVPAAQDSELVHRALKALRRDHDPALAVSLLDQQRARYGNGPLAEEALALQIEASALLKQVRSRELAREYLARYPSGRYRSIVQRALQEAAP